MILNGTVSPSAITVNSSTNNFVPLTSGRRPCSAATAAWSRAWRSSVLTIFRPARFFSGAVKISGGTIYAGNNCFNQVSSITITNNSTLDLGGGTFNTSKPITVSGTGANGQGAIYNSYNDTPGEVMNITLAGDTKFGSSARWDLVNGSQINGAHSLTLDWSAGSGYGEWNTAGRLEQLATGITLTNGNLGSKNMDATFQNPATVFTISPSRQLVFWNGGWGVAALHALSAVLK